MTLTVSHFERWLDGQITFGIDLERETDFFGRYLRQHSADQADDDLWKLMRRFGARRNVIAANRCSARAVKEAIAALQPVTTVEASDSLADLAGALALWKAGPAYSRCRFSQHNR